jgi:hypothetical protein
MAFFAWEFNQSLQENIWTILKTIHGDWSSTHYLLFKALRLEWLEPGWYEFGTKCALTEHQKRTHQKKLKVQYKCGLIK